MGDKKTPKIIVPVSLGKTARAVLLCVINATFPANGDSEVITVRTITERVGGKIGQTRTILRSLRGRGLVHVVASTEDRIFKYEAAEDAADRLEAGDIEKAERAEKQIPAAVEPMATELYSPLALKLAALDRAIVRWTGTSYRERKAITSDGSDPKDATCWNVRKLFIDGTEVSLMAFEVGPHLRTIRSTIVSDPAFVAAQRIVDAELVASMDEVASDTTEESV